MLLYALADENISANKTGQSTLSDNELPEVDWNNPDALWDYYLEDVSFDDKTVLDPFMGGGTSIVESLRMDADAIGSELNPVAWFIVKKEAESVDLDALDAAYDELEASVGAEIQDYYRTECPHCDDHHADAMYYFWVKQLPCLNCGEDVPLFKDYALAAARSSKDDHYNVVCPDCWNVFEADDRKSETECPDCACSFTPSDAGNVSRGNYSCPHCDANQMQIIESVERHGKPDADLYAVEYYCPETGEKGYKSVAQFDRDLYADAEAELAEIRAELPVPTQRRYAGSSDRARNHGYETYDQMFNARQLLGLGKLLREIDGIDDQNVKEFLLLAFSDSLTFHNMFCEYHKTANKVQGMYKRHTITARHQPVENNIWGTEYGAGTFSTEFDKMRAGKEFCQNPYEKYIDENGDTAQKDGVGKIDGQLVDDPADLGDEGNVHLRCGSSEYLPVEDGTVDAVITDPPYFDNVMYAEVADFYYVWLKQVLEDEYDHFTAELTPKASEIVTDPAKDVDTHRDRDHFITGLTNVFSESRRVLSNDGLMAFTFHHKDTEGWSSVLQSVLDAGFYVTALYPVRGEMRGSTHIHDKANIEYDMIVVCRKREDDPSEVSWRSLEDDIYFRASEEIARLEDGGSTLSQGDVFAVTMGKCLEVYSQHYPNVVRDGVELSVEDAIERIREIVDEQLMEERVEIMAEEMDTLSAVYLSYVLGRGEEIAFNSLNKELQQRGVDVAELVTEGLLTQDGDHLTLVAPGDRAERIESKRDTLAVDRAHYLRYLYDEDRLAQDFQQWTDEESIAALRRLARTENDDDYADIADYVEERSDEQLDIDDFA
jgi:adenine-specific DNA methylase